MLLYQYGPYNSVCLYTSGQFLGHISNSDGSSFCNPCFIISDKTDCTLAMTMVFLPTKFTIRTKCFLYFFF